MATNLSRGSRPKGLRVTFVFSSANRRAEALLKTPALASLLSTEGREAVFWEVRQEKVPNLAHWGMRRAKRRGIMCSEGASQEER